MHARFQRNLHEIQTKTTIDLERNYQLMRIATALKPCVRTQFHFIILYYSTYNNITYFPFSLYIQTHLNEPRTLHRQDQRADWQGS